MILLNSFDIHQDFWKTNPEASVLFNEEYESKVSSPHMWAHALLTHPDSKFFNESPSVRRTLIIEDYLKDPSFQFSPELIQKFQRYTLSKPQRLLVNWEQKLHQRDEFIASLDYSAETFDLLDKMIDKTPKL